MLLKIIIFFFSLKNVIKIKQESFFQIRLLIK